MIIERLSLERIYRNSTVSRETIIGGGRFVLRKCLQAARYVQENALMVEAQLGQVIGEIREVVAQTDL